MKIHHHKCCGQLAQRNVLHYVPHSFELNFSCKVCGATRLPFMPATHFDGWDSQFEAIRQQGLAFDAELERSVCQKINAQF